MNKTPIDDPIAKEMLVWTRKDGTRISIVAQIGKPYQLNDTEWACPAELQGVDGQYPDIKGVGSMQVLCMAIHLIKSRLGHLLDDGEDIRHVEDMNWKWDSRSLQATFGK